MSHQPWDTLSEEWHSDNPPSIDNTAPHSPHLTALSTETPTPAPRLSTLSNPFRTPSESNTPPAEDPFQNENTLNGVPGTFRQLNTPDPASTVAAAAARGAPWRGTPLQDMFSPLPLEKMFGEGQGFGDWRPDSDDRGLTGVWSVVKKGDDRIRRTVEAERQNGVGTSDAMEGVVNGFSEFEGSGAFGDWRPSEPITRGGGRSFGTVNDVVQHATLCFRNNNESFIQNNANDRTSPMHQRNSISARENDLKISRGNGNHGNSRVLPPRTPSKSQKARDSFSFFAADGAAGSFGEPFEPSSPIPPMSRGNEQVLENGSLNFLEKVVLTNNISYSIDVC